MSSVSLETIPQEVLEHIAFYAATDTFLGPPSAIPSLLLTSGRINNLLSITSNYHLHARIFSAKFDLEGPTRRLGPQKISSEALASELRRRCVHMKRLRRDSFAKIPDTDTTSTREILWTAFLMMLDNDGKNERQLREYAKIDQWLKDYWFAPRGASLAYMDIARAEWPRSDRHNALAMWLFWFLLRPSDYVQDSLAFRDATGILKIYALGAHRYPLSLNPWTSFIPSQDDSIGQSLLYFSERLTLSPPPLAVPAILSYVTLVNAAYSATERADFSTSFIPPRRPLSNTSRELDVEWKRCLAQGQPSLYARPSGAFKPGSIEGAWEGLFTYSEFGAYTELLSGAPPEELHRSVVAQHRQTWKLREHHINSHPGQQSDSVLENQRALSGGDPLRAYFPSGTHIQERLDGLTIQEPGRPGLLSYVRAIEDKAMGDDHRSCPENDTDVIITGEGHSAWGQFNLIGRVRPSDGLISLSKEYINGDRGKWLYRGYLVGNVEGYFGGRWRDTLSPANVCGYEGCFMMGRRR